MFVCVCEELYPQDICIIHEHNCAKAAEAGGASAPIAPLSSPKISTKKRRRDSSGMGQKLVFSFLIFFLQVTVEITVMTQNATMICVSSAESH